VSVMTNTAQGVFLFGGEGAHSADLDLSILKTSPAYELVDAAMQEQHGVTADSFLQEHLGHHAVPWSPVVTTMLNILQADLWRMWGHEPCYALGHSIGELAAAYVSGILTVPWALRIAYENGTVAASLQGKMLHTTIPADQLHLLPHKNMYLAGVNHGVLGTTDVSVTLCGQPEAVQAWLDEDESAVELKPQCPWHHPDYLRTEACARFKSDLGPAWFKQKDGSTCQMISSMTASVVTELDAAHWKAWLSRPVNFKTSLELLCSLAKAPLYVIQCAPHPVLDGAIEYLSHHLVQTSSTPLTAHCASMRRGVSAVVFLREQRAKLAKAGLLAHPLLDALRSSGALVTSKGFHLDPETPFAEQGITSAQIPALSHRLAPYFPGLKPHDFYRFTSVRAMLRSWDTSTAIAGDATDLRKGSDANLDVIAWGLRLPPCIQSAEAAWAAFVNGDSAIKSPPEGFACPHDAGYLDPSFDTATATKVAREAGIDAAEASAIEPQHALALELVGRMFDELGNEGTAAVLSDRQRVGVYLGAWQSPATDGLKKSAYTAIGTSISALAARVANVHNLQGPALTINTACSSALVAVDQALRDARAGRIDYAIVGGVNLIASSPSAVDAFTQLRRANMLSPTARCHTFSAAADGYVRAEGGVVFLVRSTAAPPPAAPLPCRATILGAAINQNSTRKPMSAVDPAAQERVVSLACADAGISPEQLAAIELHGTGTKLGDPVELSALARVTANAAGAKGMRGGCTVTAAKMHFGHLESAAGGVGLLKVCLMLEKRKVPAFSVDAPGLNSALESILEESRLQLPPNDGMPLVDGAFVGVSSFGFAGNNAHVVLSTARTQVILPMGAAQPNTLQTQQASITVAQPRVSPGSSIPQPLDGASFATLDAADTGGKVANADKAARIVWAACCGVTGSESPLDLDANLFNIGIDSLGLAELVIQLEDVYGEGAITVDELMANPVVRDIARRLPGGKSAEHTTAIQAPLSPQVNVIKKPSATTLASSIAPPPLLPVTPFAKPFATPSAPPLVTPQVHSRGSDLSTPSSVELVARLSHVESVCEELRSALRALTPARLDAPTSVATPVAVAVAAPAVAAMDICQPVKPEALPPPLQMKWIRTTHVGSLPRAMTGEDSSPAAIIALQKAAGIDLINDGEWSRDNYVADMLSRIENIGSTDGLALVKSCLCEMPCASDMRDVPTYAQRFTGGNGLITLNPKRVACADTACTGVPTYKAGGTAELRDSLAPFVQALSAAGCATETGFWSVPSPGTLAVFCEDRYYGDHATFVEALAEAMRPEYETIAASGLMLQVDCPDLAMGRHTRFADLSDEEFAAVADVHVAALNSALAAVPAAQVRIHICWGNYAGPHHHDIAASSVWPYVARINAKFILVEAANPRHGHEVAAFEEAVASGLIDDSKVIVPGVIDTTAARVEHPAHIAERLLRFVRAVGHPSRVIAATDCGFASTARSVAITADIAWRKLNALAEGAALATKLYLQHNAPVPMKSPETSPTPFRAAIFVGGSAAAAAAGRAIAIELRCHASSVEVLPCNSGVSVPQRAQEAADELRWAVDFPIALVAVGGGTPTMIAARAAALLRSDGAVSRRPSTVFYCGGPPPIEGLVALGDAADALAVAERVARQMMEGTGFDKRSLALPRNEKPLPSSVDVVVVGSGVLGMIQAQRLREAGHSVAVLEQRALVGGIWSMYANSTSQVNSSEGGYCLKEFLPNDSPRKHAHNRDHSTAAEVLADLAELGKSLSDVTWTQVKVVSVLGANGDYHVVASHESPHHASSQTAVVHAKGIVLAINDRVGMPRSLCVPGMDSFDGVVADGTSDALMGVDWRGKRVVIFGMGAFAVENARTALESGAAHVTVVARRLGTICPKMIDYLNFVKPWDEAYRHDTATNVKQMTQWRKVYKESGATAPDCWPGKVKHEGHTISVSDVWFVASHLGMLETKVGTLERMDETGCVLSDCSHLLADIVVGCIGFERNTTFCEQLTGRTVVKHSNYLDKNMMYLADAEIDEGAFNSFFGSSVVEYAKFFSKVYVEAFERPDQVGVYLWGDSVPTTPLALRKWTQYIATSATLIKEDEAIKKVAADLVKKRTEHFYRTMPPRTFLEVNRKEWQELHTRLNGNVPLPAEKQLAYPFNEAAEWCLPLEAVLGH